MGVVLFFVFLATVLFLSLSVAGVVWWYYESKQMDESFLLPDPRERDDIDYKKEW